MKLSPRLDLGKSLAKVFDDPLRSAVQIARTQARQEATAAAVLQRFFSPKKADRREMILLADEVGLGKTYVALAVAVSLLDAIRTGGAGNELPRYKPVVLVLAPNNDALFHKWLREAQTLKNDCAAKPGALDWLRIVSPQAEAGRSGNMIHLASLVRQATRSRPQLLVAKYNVLGAALHDRQLWRRRALAALFARFRLPLSRRRRWCRWVLGSGARSEVPELLDLRKSAWLWHDDKGRFPRLQRAFRRAVDHPAMGRRLQGLLEEPSPWTLQETLDDLVRLALALQLPRFPLVVIDEIHNLKNQRTRFRSRVTQLLDRRILRLLGLSATPFQLHHQELESVLELRKLLRLPAERVEALDRAAEELRLRMRKARAAGNAFRVRWLALRPGDQRPVARAWRELAGCDSEEQDRCVRLLRPPRVAHAVQAALELQTANRQLQEQLRRFVIRHRRDRRHREHFVGCRAEPGNGPGTPEFRWAPGLEVRGGDELPHYLMMRAVSLAREEKGLPGLGAELTGSYRHLLHTAAVWRRLKQARNPVLRVYCRLLEEIVHRGGDPDEHHRKIRATARRTLEFFRAGRKTLIFCVNVKTAEALRDRIQKQVGDHLQEVRRRAFGSAAAFHNFRRRFFNRRESLFSLIQDHPLLGRMRGRQVGVPAELRLDHKHLHQLARLLLRWGESPGVPHPDRRLLLAAAEHVAVTAWRKTARGERWLARVLAHCPELAERMADEEWLRNRQPLSRPPRFASASRGPADSDGELFDPLELELLDERPAAAGRKGGTTEDEARWARRLRKESLGQVVAPYFRRELIKFQPGHLPLLPAHHGESLARLDLHTRSVAGQVFRRILMAEEFLLRYLLDVPRDDAAGWAEFLARRYTQVLPGHQETLKDRVAAYLETLVRALRNQALIDGYHRAAENRNIVQLVKGGTERDRYFLGFNTPYRPEILITTSVGQEGIDLHRECRHVIHHDLCWNPAVLEQRTGRVDRIGSKVHREQASARRGAGAPRLEVVVPYLAATYDERMFEELYRRSQLLEVTLGGDIRVDGPPEVSFSPGWEKVPEAGTGSPPPDPFAGFPAPQAVVSLPQEMVEQLRIDLSVWKPPPENAKEPGTGAEG